MPNKSFAARILEWETRAKGLTANASDLPFLSDLQTEFGTLLTAVKDLNAQQETLKAQTQQTTQQLNGKLAQLEKLDARLTSHLQGKYGKSDKKLEEFGLSALRSKSHKTKLTASVKAS